MACALGRLVHIAQRSAATAFSSAALPPPTPLQDRRVVVTGMGCVTPLGVGVQASWDALLAGQCGVEALADEAFASIPARIAATVKHGPGDGQFNMASVVSNSRTQGVKFIAYALAAAAEALHAANWHPTTAADRQRTGVVVGSGIGSLQEIVDAWETFSAKGYKRLSPFFVPRSLINLAAGHISIQHGLQGPNHSCVTACATGAHAIGDAYRMIRQGDADVMVAGGTESCVDPLSVAGFARLQALTTKYNDNPAAASRPFDAERSGFVIAEGAGVLVLEELEHAHVRGATPLAEVRGYGLSGDAHHITAPAEDGDGARRCMEAALRQSGLAATDIDHINAHATSTPLGDLVEARAIRALFGKHAQQLVVSATKASTGHMLGAAGAVEAIFTVQAIAQSVIPPTLNVDRLDEQVQLTVATAPRHQRVRAALSNSFGFGGTNACLLLTQPPR